MQLLEELETHGPLRLRALHIEADLRKPGAPQLNLVQRYLDHAREHGREVEEGFTAALTEFLASAAERSLCDSDFYERIADTEEF